MSSKLGSVRALLLGTIALGAASLSDRAMAQQAVTLTLWQQASTPAHETVLKQQLETCSAQQPNVKVALQSVGLDVMYPRLATSLRDRRPPNVIITVESVVAFLHDKKSLVAVDDVIDGHGRADFIPAFLQAVSAEGKTWAVPDWALHHAVWYRKDLLAQAGIQSTPKTWAELEAMAAKLTIDKDGDGKPDQFGFAVPWGAKFFAAQQSLFDALYAEGITVVDPKTGNYSFAGRKADAVQALDYMMKMHKAYSPPASIDWTLLEIRTALMNGQIAAGAEWGGVVKFVEQQRPELLDQLSVFPFPAHDGPAKASLGGGFYMMIGTAPEAEVAASKKLVACLMQPSEVARRANSRAIFALPAINSAYDSEAFKSDPINVRFAKEIETIRRDVINRWYRYGLEAGLNPVSSIMESTSVINESMQKVALGRQTSAQAIDELDQFMKSSLDRR
ncbi:extracellular solute-binding protein [Bradyrhizobium sp.]|uniref:extracellular solute-binding protein n=1 Tax=Bradyrhizobium sp. TaxID=376 RepID=UPI0039E54F2E